MLLSQWQPTQSPLHYLFIPLPDIPTQATFNFRNTTNACFISDDTTQIVAWPQFHYGAIIRKYGPALNAKQINPDPFSSFPPAIRDESQFQLRFAELILPRIRRSPRRFRATCSRASATAALRSDAGWGRFCRHHRPVQTGHGVCNSWW